MVIEKVLRAQRTAKSLQTLKVIQLMNFKTRASPKQRLDEEAGWQSPVANAGLSPEKKASLQEVFQLFDADESGHISVVELMSVFRSLGQHISEVESSELIHQLDRETVSFLSTISAHAFKNTFKTVSKTQKSPSGECSPYSIATKVERFPLPNSLPFFKSLGPD